MIRAAAIGTFALCLVGTTDRSAPLPQDRPGPGISLTLAEERVRRVSDTRYNLHLTIPSDASSRVEGTVEIRFVLVDASRPLALDFVATGPVQAESQGHQIDLVMASEHLLILPADLREGQNSITIRFVAGDAALNRNPDFMYSLFVPARARLTFPCFDQPDLKAKYSLSLDVPAGWEALANGPEVERTQG